MGPWNFGKARRLALAFVVTAALGVGMAACGDSDEGSESETASGEPVVFSAFNPFTGPNAVFGPMMMSGTETAVELINENGGILGHDAESLAVDTHGDPAQAVPAAQKMLATTSNLVGVLGPSSDEAHATAPILDEAQVPFFADTGLVDFNETDMEHYWRIAPADDAKAFGMAILGADAGHQTAALVFTDDVGAASLAGTLREAFEALDGEVVLEQELAQGQSSYRTEAEAVLDANPDVVFTEMDPQTAATYLSQLKELNGDLIPVIASETSLEAPWVKAVSGAVGQSSMTEHIVGVQPHVEGAGGGEAYDLFKSTLTASDGVKKWASEGDLDNAFMTTDPYIMGWYDSINMMALAMIAADTVDPAAYNEAILDVTDPGEGKVEVGAFAEGKEALENGEDIQYIGASGPFVFNEWHNSAPSYESVTTISPGETETAGIAEVARITELMNDQSEE